MNKTKGMVLAAFVAVVGSAFAHSAPTVPEPHRPVYGCLVDERLTGNWGGLRDSLEDSGVWISAENVFEYSGVMSGGLQQRGAGRNLFTAGLELDTKALLGLEGGTFFAQFLSVNAEKGGSRDAGDLQGYTNIESDRSLNTLYEVWYQHVWLEDRLRVKVGKVDANSEFAYVAPLREVSAACEFTHSTAGFVPTIAGFPSYPDPAMSINLFATLLEGEQTHFTLAYGLYDGALGVDGVRTGSSGASSFFSDRLSDDYFHVAEGQYAWNHLCGMPGGGSLSVGGWLHTGDWPRFSGGTTDGTAGWYATVQQQVTAPNEEDDDCGLYLFGQYGHSDDRVVEVGQVIAVGALQRGLCGLRPADLAGVFASFADLSDDPAAGFERDELAVEAMYRFMITLAVWIQPGMQYIFNPSGDPAIDDALVGQVRFGITL